ncbi:MAG TPA: hypothetical protein VHC67_14235 [Gaiellaceae bacterium]|jgi:hypothetical protein|nr:hypothetical protein [Gaiellaceae bacterium]
MKRSSLWIAAVALALTIAGSGGAAPPTLAFTPFAHVAPKMDSIVWTGKRFLFVENTANTVWSAPASGKPLRRFATMPKLTEETRCALSPGAHGWPAGMVYCHSPDHRIYELSPGGNVRLFARLRAPYPPAGDGALAFDTVGTFGYRLVAATGRSGAQTPSGGTVFTIDRGGSVRVVGGYPGPGGADELAIAPASFGTAKGEALLTVDPGTGGGTVVAVSAKGTARVIARLPDGPNPIVVLGSGAPAAGAKPGLYLTDDTGQDIYYAPAPAGHDGGVLVGGEASGAFWLLRPRGAGFSVLPVASSLTGKGRSLEAMLELVPR